MGTYEMFWDCGACGTRKLLGKSHRHCPNCGRVQDPAWRYFPPEDEKVAVHDHLFHGVDWRCERCDTPNSAAANHCINCGDARDGVERDVTRRESVLAGTQSGALTDDEPIVFEPIVARRSGWPMIFGALAVAAAIVIVLGVISIYWTSPTEVGVTGHTWQRDVHIEELAPRSRGSWCDSMPSDAYSISRDRRQRSTRSIPDGESCATVNVDNGDGTFSTQQECHTTYREEPVYDDYCSYTVDRWGHVRTETAKGRGFDPEPSWPAFSVSDCGHNGCTRVGSRRESYWVHLLDSDGTQHVCDFSQSTWHGMPVGSQWAGRKQVVWDRLVCGQLEEVP